MRNLVAFIMLYSISAFGAGTVLPPPTSNQTAVTQWAYNPALTDINAGTKNVTNVVQVIGTNGLSINLNTGELGGTWPIETSVAAKAPASTANNLPPLFAPMGASSYAVGSRAINEITNAIEVYSTEAYTYPLWSLYAKRTNAIDTSIPYGIQMWHQTTATTNGWTVGSYTPFFQGGYASANAVDVTYQFYSRATATNEHEMVWHVRGSSGNLERMRLTHAGNLHVTGDVYATNFRLSASDVAMGGTKATNDYNTLYAIATNKAAASYLDNLPAMFLPAGSASFANSGRGHNATTHRTDIFGTNWQHSLFGLYMNYGSGLPTNTGMFALQAWQYTTANVTNWTVGAQSPRIGAGLHDAALSDLQYSFYGEAISTNRHQFVLETRGSSGLARRMTIDDSGNLVASGTVSAVSYFGNGSTLTLTNIQANVQVVADDVGIEFKRILATSSNGYQTALGVSHTSSFVSFQTPRAAYPIGLGPDSSGTNLAFSDGAGVTRTLIHDGNIPASLQTVAAFNNWSTNAMKVFFGSVTNGQTGSRGTTFYNATNLVIFIGDTNKFVITGVLNP